MNISQRIKIENEIVFLTVQSALDLGFTVEHNNGEEITAIATPNEENRALSFKRLMDEVQQCDEEYITIKDDKGLRVGMVYFVYGNDGYDVINDHTVNDDMEKILAPANALAESYSEGQWVTIA